MTELKLLALDAEDLGVVSAHMQDAVLKAADLRWSPKDKSFSLVANRFVWEAVKSGVKSYERRRSALVFKRVNSVRSTGVNRGKDEVHSLLAVTFTQHDDGPEGQVELVLSGKATIALDVECIEAALADVGGAWETASKPRHI